MYRKIMELTRCLLACYPFTPMQANGAQANFGLPYCGKLDRTSKGKGKSRDGNMSLHSTYTVCRLQVFVSHSRDFRFCMTNYPVTQSPPWIKSLSLIYILFRKCQIYCTGCFICRRPNLPLSDSGRRNGVRSRGHGGGTGNPD